MKKRILSFVLAALMCISLCSGLATPVSAAESGGAAALVAVAKAQPKGTSGKKYANWYHNNNSNDPGQWCAKFVAWCAHEAGIPKKVIPKYASCKSMYDALKRNGATVVKEPQAGDLVFYKKANGNFCHVGIVIGYYKNGAVKTVQGNTNLKEDEPRCVQNPMKAEPYYYYAKTKSGDYELKRATPVYVRPNYSLMDGKTEDTNADADKTDTPAADAGVNQGTYRIHNLNTDVYMQGLRLESATAVRGHLLDENEPMQIFELMSLENGHYAICANGDSDLRVGVYEKDEVQQGSSVNLLKKRDNELMREWILEKVDGGYVLRSAADENMVLTAGGFNAVNNRASLNVRRYENDEKQIWQFEKVEIIGKQPEAGKSYTITNKAANKVLDVYGDTDKSKNKSNVQIYDKTGSNKSQKFQLTDSGNGWYNLSPLSGSKLAVNPYSNTPKAGTNVNVYTLDPSDRTQGWIFEAVGDYYIIRSAYNENLVLTANGSKNMSNVKLGKYVGNDYQLWKLD